MLTANIYDTRPTNHVNTDSVEMTHTTGYSELKT